MKHWLVLTMTATAFAATQTATIQIERDGKTREFRLSRDAAGVLCKPPDQPERHIHVKGLRSLAAPFRPPANPPGAECAQKLTWVTGSKRSATCYRFGENEVLDDVLRWCTTL